jgi:di/tricarboxylate transporter
MSIEAWVTLAVVAGLFIGLLKDAAPTDVLFIGATTFLAAVRIISPEEAFAGFSNSGMLTVAFLFIVVAGLRETGVLDQVGHRVLGGVRSERGLIVRLSGVIVPLSALLNNTPIVAMFVPIVIDWSRRHQVSPSKVLIPLSYLTILGGTCSLIGTSTNLIVNGLMVDNGMLAMGLFEIGQVGLPYAIVGVVYLCCFGSRLLPDRKELLEQFTNARRDYLIEKQVQSGCRLIGKTVDAAGLRHLPGLFLAEIERAGKRMTPARPDDTIEQGDRLVFAGVVTGIVELDKIAGLSTIDESYVSESPRERRDRRLCEAVVSHTSTLIGKSIRDAEFRSTFGAVVIAVHRSGKRVNRKLGDIKLQAGDALLMQTEPNFLQQHRHDPAFYLVSMVEDWRPIRDDRAWIAIAIFALLIILMVSGWVPVVVASAMAAIAMVATRCLSSGDAQRSVEWQVLVTIAASFGVGTALQNSGVATVIAGGVVDATHFLGPIAAIAVVYCVGSILTELITNNAAAVLLFPFCIETARLYDVDPRSFVIALALAASASFMTPIGYQTNMMVYGPGGYRFSDFIRIGTPLNILLGIVAIALIPFFWPL